MWSYDSESFLATGIAELNTKIKTFLHKLNDEFGYYEVVSHEIKTITNGFVSILIYRIKE